MAQRGGRIRQTLRWLAGASAWGYLVVVVLYWIALRFVGESWWLTTVCLYLPHVLAVGPAVPLVLLLAVVGPRKLIALPVVAAVLVIVPIMGLVVFGGAEAPSGAPRLRVLSYNVDSGRRGHDALAAQILEIKPDIVLLQETDPQVGDTITAGLTGYLRQATGQFYIASRWPIEDTLEPPKIPVRGAERTPRFVRYKLTTPLGPLEIFNVHPISPRDGFESIRGTGLAKEADSGGFLFNDRDALVHNTELRRAQAETFTRLAGEAKVPVLIAGDTNLPSHSSIFADTLARYQDGFATVGRGFGYTFPAHKGVAWMRIDRILASRELRFLDFGVGTRRASDHYCVWADLERGK